MSPIGTKRKCCRIRLMSVVWGKNGPSPDTPRGLSLTDVTIQARGLCAKVLTQGPRRLMAPKGVL